MTSFKRICIVAPLAILMTSCATTGDIERLEGDIQRLESKIDLIVQATQRSSLEEIFGDQSVSITTQLNKLDSAQAKQFEALQQAYTRGAKSLEEVRGEMLSVLGNNNRIVATSRGIYIRDSEGKKLKAISNGTKITATKQLSDSQTPSSISSNSVLNKLTWGTGILEGETIVFPWELTMSTFTKEIVENTARRTAEEFIKMGGEKAWTRPVIIEVAMQESDKLNITANEDDSEVFVRNSSDAMKEMPINTVEGNNNEENRSEVK